MTPEMRTFRVKGTSAALCRFFGAARAYQNRHNGKCLIAGSSPATDDRTKDGWCLKGYDVLSDQPDLLMLISEASGVECYEKINQRRENEIRNHCFEELPRRRSEIEATVENVIEKKLHITSIPTDMFVGLAEAWLRSF